VRIVAQTRTIEIDAATADELESRAASRGVSVREMIAELVALDDAAASGAAAVAELERQWADIEAGAPTVPHEKVARWLTTWGTADFKPWHSQ
jgi:predicted transcriptional regulator